MRCERLPTYRHVRGITDPGKGAPGSPPCRSAGQGLRRYSYSYSYILEDSIPPTTTTFSDGRFASSSTSAVTRFRLHSPLVGRSTLTPPRWPRSLWSDGESRCDGLHLARVRVPRNKGEAGGLSAQRAYRVSCMYDVASRIVSRLVSVTVHRSRLIHSFTYLR